MCTTYIGLGVSLVPVFLRRPEEHSLELHTPFIARCLGTKNVTLVPIMVGSISSASEKKYADLLAPYMEDPANLFIISSDFCHWGSRFNYTYYDPAHGSIWESIQWLDQEGIKAIESGDPATYAAYQSKYENTICGRHPIGILLHLIVVHMKATGSSDPATCAACQSKYENTICGRHPIGILLNMLKMSSHKHAISFKAYDQSSRCKTKSDSSVSYAAGVVTRLNDPQGCSTQRVRPAVRSATIGCNAMSSLPNVDPRSAQDSAPTTPRSTGEQPKGGIGKLLNKMGLKLKIKSPFAHESPRSGGKASEARQSPTMADSTYASSPTKPLTKPTFPSVIKGGSQPVGGDDRDSARFSYSSSMDRASGSRSSDTRSSRSTRDSAMSAASQEAQMKVRDKAGMEYGSEDSGMVDRDSARDSANRESGKKDRETAPLDDALVVERKEEVEGEIQTGAGPETAIHSSKPIVGSSHVTAPKADISLPLPTLSPVPPRLLAPSPAPPALIATNPNSIRELGPPNLLVTTPPSPSPKGRFANIKQLIKNAVSSPGKSQNIVKPDSKFVVATADTSTPAQAGNLSSTLSSLKSCPEPSAASPASPFSPAGAKLPISSLRAVGGPSTGGTSRSPKSDILSMAKNLPPGMDRDCWCIEDYSRLQKIHSGYASSVYRAHCRYSNAAVVLKVYKPDRLHIISQHQLTRECRIHVNLDHPNIIRLYSSFRQADNVVLVQEYADGGDLLQLLLKNGSRLSERTAVTLVVQPILKAIAYLHDESIVHRDIKLENVLFAGSGLTLKLADFGLCINLREERSVTRAGTLDYMAPEVLKCPTKSFPEENKHRLDLSYSVTVDIWAMSVMTYELLNGCPPFTRPESPQKGTAPTSR
eukprot:gene12757-16008_t